MMMMMMNGHDVYISSLSTLYISYQIDDRHHDLHVIITLMIIIVNIIRNGRMLFKPENGVMVMVMVMMMIPTELWVYLKRNCRLMMTMNCHVLYHGRHHHFQISARSDHHHPQGQTKEITLREVSDSERVRR